MIRLIFLTDFTERFAYNLLKGILAYAKNHEQWVVCRMPPSFMAAYGMEGVRKWAMTWQADAPSFGAIGLSGTHVFPIFK